MSVPETISKEKVTRAIATSLEYGGGILSYYYEKYPQQVAEQAAIFGREDVLRPLLDTVYVFWEKVAVLAGQYGRIFILKQIIDTHEEQVSWWKVIDKTFYRSHRDSPRIVVDFIMDRIYHGDLEAMLFDAESNDSDAAADFLRRQFSMNY